MEHAYTYAAAALIDQVDRALSAVEGEPARVAVVTNESGMEVIALEITRDFVEEAGDVCRVVVECDGVTG